MHSTHTHPDFDRFRSLLTIHGGALADLDARHLAREEAWELVYVPFHHVNADAKLVVVGITPGPTQVRLAYESARRGLKAGRHDGDILMETKREAAFGGPKRRNLGPTPLDALDWCVAKGALRPEQVLGAFAHPSAGGGSQVDVYLGAKTMADLSEKDPVRHRVANLRRASARMAAAVAALRPAEGATIAAPSPASASVPPIATTSGAISAGQEVEAVRHAVGRDEDRAAPSEAPAIEGIHAFVSRGANKGMLLRPHLQDGHYIVSPTRFEQDYVRVPETQSLIPYLEAGFRLRMSSPTHVSSLFSSASIHGWRD